MDLLPNWWPKTLPDSHAPTHGWPLAFILPAVVVSLMVFKLLLTRFPHLTARLEIKISDLRKGTTVVLGIAAAFAILNYMDYGLFRYGTYHNEWSLYHHYVGTKYASELGYYNIYGATVIADLEGESQFPNCFENVRDLRSYKSVPVQSILNKRDAYKNLFTPERFQEFKSDIAWFKAQFPEERWCKIVLDHGYNATPIWTLVVGSVLTSNLDIEITWQRMIMLLVDPALIVAALLCVAWAFNLECALLMIVFMGTHYLLSWGHLKGALLRTDFAMVVLMAICLLKKGYYKTSGVLIGWGAVSRVFPVFFLLGPIVRALTILKRDRRIDKNLFALLLASAITVAVLFMTSLVSFGGTEIWQQWFQKISTHKETLTWTIGYRSIFDTHFLERIPEMINPPAFFAEEPLLLKLHTVTHWFIVLTVCIPCLYFVRDRKDHETIFFGFVLVFFLVNVSYYYYLILTVPFLYFSTRIERPHGALGVVFMFATGMAGYVFYSGWDPLRDSTILFRGYKQEFQTYYFMSWMVAITALHMVIVAGKESVKIERHPRSSPKNGL